MRNPIEADPLTFFLETFRWALFTNAFADHFLTDAFAAGHVRVPRAEEGVDKRG